jgi:chromosome segregation ATPase
MKELEEKLTDLQGRHSELTQSYETLQLEYSAVKQELETLRNNYENVLVTKRRYLSSIKEWDAPRAEPSDLLLFDASAFCYEAEEESGHKGQRG